MLNGVKENSAELLDIMLLKAHGSFPTKALGKALGIHEVATGKLQVCEELLKLVRDAIVFISVEVFVVGPGVDKRSEFRCHIE